MTVNEYNYAQLKNSMLQNVETAKHNRAMEALEAGKLDESKRHSMVTESIERQKADESIRHDYVMEGVQRASNAITDFYNRGRLTQGEEDLRQQGEVRSASADKTRGESSLLYDTFNLNSRRTDSEIYKNYRGADASMTSAQAHQQQADVAKFNAEVNAVLGTANMVTGSITNLISSLRGGKSNTKADPTLGNILRKRAAEGRK